MHSNVRTFVVTLSLSIALLCCLTITSCKKSPAPGQQQSQNQLRPQPLQPQLPAKPQQPAGPQTPPAAQSQAPNASGLVPIDIKLPKPMFVGTPQDIAVPNLEKPLGEPRAPFLAPAGTVNVALNKPVTGSDKEPIIGELKMITDGDNEASDGSYVEMGPMLQNVTIDLQAKYNIYAVVVWHFHKQARVYNDVVVQVADDPDFIQNVKTIFNNDHDNSAGLGAGTDKSYVETAEGKLIDAKGVVGRYVRLYSRGNTSNDLNHYIEVQVFGKPAI